MSDRKTNGIFQELFRGGKERWLQGTAKCLNVYLEADEIKERQQETSRLRVSITTGVIQVIMKAKHIVVICGSLLLSTSFILAYSLPQVLEYLSKLAFQSQTSDHPLFRSIKHNNLHKTIYVQQSP